MNKAGKVVSRIHLPYIGQRVIKTSIAVFLCQDHLSQISSSVLFRLSYLNQDGAGIYDANENIYLSTGCMPLESSEWLMGKLNNMGLSYFIYTVNKNRNFIYHRGTLSGEEQQVMQRMRRSPYRHYLNDDSLELQDIVYIKIIAREDRAERIWREMRDTLASNGLRIVLRPQPGLDGVNGLYFYASEATVEDAKARVLEMIRDKHPEVQARKIV